MAKAPIKLPVSRGRSIVIDKKTGKPKAKPARKSASQRIAERKKPKTVYRPASNPDDVD